MESYLRTYRTDMRRTGLSSEKQRLKQLLWLLIRKYHPNCCICGEPFVYEDILPSRGVDQLTDHHFDGDHDNSDPQNRGLAHRRCHKKHHVKDNIQKEKHGR